MATAQQPGSGQPVVEWTVPGRSGPASSGRTMSRLVLGGLGLGVLAHLASIAHFAGGPSLIASFLAGGASKSDLDAWDATSASIGLIESVVFLATGVIWLVWQYRLVASVEPITHDAPLTSPGKSVVWWFVPFADLLMVYRIYRDLATKFGVGGGMIVGLWWTSYLLSNVLVQVAGAAWRSVSSPAGFDAGIQQWIVSDSVWVVSALLAIRLVVRLQRGQDRAIAAPPVSGWAPPAEERPETTTGPAVERTAPDAGAPGSQASSR